MLYSINYNTIKNFFLSLLNKNCIVKNEIILVLIKTKSREEKEKVFCFDD